MSRTLRLEVSAGIVAAIIGVAAALAALPSFAASEDYPFNIRGIVQSVDKTNMKIVVQGTKSSAKAVAETQSKEVQYSLKSVKIWKWENGKQVARNISFVKPNDEVVMIGRKVSGTFVVDKLTINDRKFTVVGRVKDYNTAENWIKVRVGRSTLQHKGVVNTDIKFYYDDDTTCMRLGNEIDCSEIASENQGIRIDGERSSTGGKWNATKIWNRFPI
ncbi:MAG: hypothetical protein HYR90_04680 [Candidatus Andersenbacteria bacterium]|nr:hypothetical protein [Candidatus Andersenbacteria bacterium]MBI3250432.1 hypothetical protein [Candidatus Andersenbacteria bacterium]